jgi:hypothetical protein
MPIRGAGCRGEASAKLCEEASPKPKRSSAAAEVRLSKQGGGAAKGSPPSPRAPQERPIRSGADAPPEAAPEALRKPPDEPRLKRCRDAPPAESAPMRREPPPSPSAPAARKRWKPKRPLPPVEETRSAAAANDSAAPREAAMPEAAPRNAPEARSRAAGAGDDTRRCGRFPPAAPRLVAADVSAHEDARGRAGGSAVRDSGFMSVQARGRDRALHG